jgi:hypothetical protein
MPPYRLVTVAEDRSIVGLWNDIEAGAFQEYNDHGDVLGEDWHRLVEDFDEFQFVLFESEEPVGLGQTIPFLWDGTIPDLGEGIDDIFVRGFADREAGHEPTTLCALLGVAAPAWRSKGVSPDIVRSMGEIAARHGLDDLVAPVRPNLKRAYPLTPIERYMRWTRGDGQPLDPWLRVHVRLGAEFLAPAPRSMRITGTVEEWEAWTGVAMPESGEYLFEDALQPVVIDRERDLGTYYEPNVWMIHRGIGKRRSEEIVELRAEGVV